MGYRLEAVGQEPLLEEGAPATPMGQLLAPTAAPLPKGRGIAGGQQQRQPAVGVTAMESDDDDDFLSLIAGLQTSDSIALPPNPEAEQAGVPTAGLLICKAWRGLHLLCDVLASVSL